MEEAVVGAVIGASIQVLLQNLLSFPVEELSLIWSFKKDLQKLKESIVTIRVFLGDAEMKQVSDEPVKRWLKKLEAASFDADHVFDELNYHLLRNKMKKKVGSFFSTSNPIVFRRKMAQKMKDIKSVLKSINQEASGLGLQKRIYVHGIGKPEAPARRETDSFAKERIFVGREKDVREIVEMVDNNTTEQVVSVLAIVGMGGLGKTTLARKVYNDERITCHFENRIWVHVSENFIPETVFKSVVASLTGEMNVEYGSREVVLQKLRNSLGGKRYLLVLDNVWDVDREIWNDFITSLEGISPVEGNIVLATTRSENVALTVKTLDIHRLRVLSQTDCWFIMKAHFGSSIPLELESIGKNIAKRCCGLPLAARVVGSLLPGRPKDEWLSIEKNWLSNFGGDGNNVLKILKLSFDNLSSPSLKKCFAYSGIFPKGSRLTRQELIELWMAEGLVQSDQDNDMETVGNKVLNLLVQSSLLHVLGRDCYGNVEYCSMHDLVHDLALSILSPKSLDDNYQVRYIFPKSLENESPPIQEEQAKFVRTLFFNGQLSHIMFSKFKCLHVLILYSEDIRELPILIGKLIHLRYLDISFTRIEILPDSIGELCHFQTLRATTEHGGKSNLRKLPHTLKYLISLRHLHIPNIELPHEIGSLTALQTLPYFQVGEEEGRRIIELGKLKNLKGELEIHNLGKVHDKEEAKRADLLHKPNILKLKFVWNEWAGDEINDENVLEGLQPHPNLMSLEINEFKSTSFPSWTLRMAVREELEGGWVRLDNLIEIKLSGCKECEEIPMLGHLQHLKFLYLQNLTNLKSIGYSFYGVEENGVCKENILVFPALERLELKDMTSLTTWAEVGLRSSSSEAQPSEVSVFRCLEYLKVANCRKLASAPSHFPCLKELEIDNMESGMPLSSICGSKLTSLRKLKTNEVDGLVCLPDGLFHNNQHLLELDIWTCHNLTHLVPRLNGGGASLRKLVIDSCSNFTVLPNDLHSLNSLEVLKIWSCPNLKSIPYPTHQRVQGFTSLRELEICYCSGLTNLPSEMIESCAPSLEELSLSGSKSLTNLPKVMSFLKRMPRLTVLGIEEVPRFVDTAEDLGSLRGLQWLGIGGASDCGDYVSFEASLDRFFPALQSLFGLTLYGMGHWDGLPDRIGRLTSLHWLYISDFGIEALPEWLGNLVSLKRLDLFKCRKLRDMPCKKVMESLTKLTDLHISKCPLLKECLEQHANNHSQWSNISHIPYITVDGRPPNLVM